MVRSLPRIVSQIPTDVRNFLDRVREYLSEGGDDRFVTVKELRSGGIVGTTSSGGITTPLSYEVVDPTIPLGLATTSGLACVFVSWTAANYLGHSHTEIWTSSTNDFSTKVFVGTSLGSLFTHNIGGGGTRYYWIRFVNLKDVQGPFNSTVGTSGTAGTDPAYLLNVLTGSITSSQLYSSLNDRINLIDGSPTTPGTIPYELSVLQGQIDTLSATPTYDNATTYTAGDIVQYSGGLYQALSTTTGNLPTNATYWLKIGDYTSLGDAVAAHTDEINTLTTDLGAETTARESLAAQMRGTYTGTDVASVTSGLIFSEKTARATAVSAETTARESLAAQMRGTYTGTDITLVTSGLIFAERTARASADASEVTSRESLATQLRGAYAGTDLASLTSGLLYSERVARSTADATEVTARESLAAQMRGTYAGTDLSLVTSGLIFSERTARAAADSTEVTARESLATQLRGTYTGTDVASLTAGLVYSERVARSTADSSLASSISTLSTTVGGFTTSIENLTKSVDGVKGLYTVKIDNNGNVAGFGLESVLDNTAISLWAASTAFTYGAVRRIASVTDKVMKCVVAGTSGTTTPTMAGAVGTTFTDGTVTWEIASSTATSTFIANVDKFAVAVPTSSIVARANTTAYAANAFVSVATSTDKMLVCKVAGTSSATAPNITTVAIGTLITDGTVTWQVASRVPLSVLTTSTVINGITVSPGVYIDGASIVNATITNAAIGDAAINTAKITDLAVTTAKVADLAVTNAKIGALAVTNAKIDNLAVTEAKIDNLTVTSGKIADLAVTNGKIANLAVDAAKIADLAVTNGKIGNLAVDAAKIADLAVTSAKIGALAVTSAKIADLAVTSAKFGDAVITSAKIVDLAVSTAKIDNFAVTAATFVNGASISFTPPPNSNVLAICRGFASDSSNVPGPRLGYLRIRRNGTVYDDVQAATAYSYSDPNGGWIQIWGDLTVAFQDTGSGSQISYNASNYAESPFTAFQWSVFILKK